jgi:hypothetical protein
VKGHQDINASPTQDQPLPPEFTLNISADGLAGSYQSQSNHKHQQVPMITPQAQTSADDHWHQMSTEPTWPHYCAKIQTEAPNLPIHYQSPRLPFRTGLLREIRVEVSQRFSLSSCKTEVYKIQQKN